MIATPESLMQRAALLGWTLTRLPDGRWLARTWGIDRGLADQATVDRWLREVEAREARRQRRAVS